MFRGRSGDYRQSLHCISMGFESVSGTGRAPLPHAHRVARSRTEPRVARWQTGEVIQAVRFSSRYSLAVLIRSAVLFLTQSCVRMKLERQWAQTHESLTPSTRRGILQKYLTVHLRAW